jgi:hypothetical protein
MPDHRQLRTIVIITLILFCLGIAIDPPYSTVGIILYSMTGIGLLLLVIELYRFTQRKKNSNQISSPTPTE